MGLRSRWGRRASALYPDVDAAVRAGIIPLASLHSGTGLDDLAVWGRTLDGVRVVGLGEATHGTREFFTLNGSGLRRHPVRPVHQPRTPTRRALRTGKTGFGHALGWPTSARSHPRGNRVGWTVRR